PRRLGLAGSGLAAVGYLGGLAILGLEAVGSMFSIRRKPKLVPAVLRSTDELIGQAFLLIALIHVSFGSFLSMQAYFGPTFTQASGAVVGVGMVRNVAPMLTGFTLAGLLAARIAGSRSDAEATDDPARLVLVRVLGAMIAGPILTLWGAAVGTVIGALVCK